MIATILRDLQQPEYIHVLINPLPIYGLAAGLIGLFVAIWQRSRRATIAALVIVLVSAASAWPVYEYGERSYDRVLSMADNDGRAWLAEHQERAEHVIWFFYALAILSAIGLIIPIKWPKSSLPLAVAVMLLGVISLGAGGYIAYAGGRIRHREFRLESPPKQLPTQVAGETAPAAAPTGSVVSAAAQVTIQTLKYSPETIEIKKGETVEWANNDVAPHTVTSQRGGEFDSGSIEADASWSHTFTQIGTFPYYCSFHTEMKGTVIVK
ncbi:MAG TPA: cupredoxin family copper-binding protein [Chthoniobacterales bacterium]